MSWDERNHRWQAQIAVDGEKHHLGRFDDPIEAAVAHDIAAFELHGEYARLNFNYSSSAYRRAS